MKVIKKASNGESRELLLKEFFLNAYLIAMLKQLGDEAGRIVRRDEELDLRPLPVKQR